MTALVQHNAPTPPTMRDLVTNGLSRERIYYAQDTGRAIVWKDLRQRWPHNVWLAWCPHMNCTVNVRAVTWYIAYHNINRHMHLEHDKRI